VKGDHLYLIHIAECMQRIDAYSQAGRKVFMESSMAQDAVIRNFEIIGEAAKRISEGVKMKYSTVPWRRLAGFRDVLIHNYMGVDLEEIWNVIEHDLHDLKRKIQLILEESNKKP